MNKKGEEFCREMESKAKSLQNWKRPAWSDSILQERLMRLGKEARAFELDVKDLNELERVAVATLIEDRI